MYNIIYELQVERDGVYSTVGASSSIHSKRLIENGVKLKKDGEKVRVKQTKTRYLAINTQGVLDEAERDDVFY